MHCAPSRTEVFLEFPDFTQWDYPLVI
jgi:hypothetical protein